MTVKTIEITITDRLTGLTSEIKLDQLRQSAHTPATLYAILAPLVGGDLEDLMGFLNSSYELAEGARGGATRAAARLDNKSIDIYWPTYQTSNQFDTLAKNTAISPVIVWPTCDTIVALIS